MLVNAKINGLTEDFTKNNIGMNFQYCENISLDISYLFENDEEEQLTKNTESNSNLNYNPISTCHCYYNNLIYELSIKNDHQNDNNNINNNDNDDDDNHHNHNDDNNGNNGHENDHNNEDNNELNNSENHTNSNNNNNSNNDNNDNDNDADNKNADDDNEDGDGDDDDENTDDEDIINKNGITKLNDKNNINSNTTKTYFINHNSTFESDGDFCRSDNKLNINTSILSNTPYDSIEASNKLTTEHSNHINFKINASTSDLSELINIKSNSLSDEFSGTESMEYIHSLENETSSTIKCENRFTNLITITQDMVNKDMKDDCANSQYDQPFHNITSVDKSEVNVVTSNNTLSAVICLEEGLADDDSWVEELDHDDFPAEESSEGDDLSFMEHEEEERHFNRCEIDFILHTIVEESGEESEVETDQGKPTELEKYFVFEIGGTDANNVSNNNHDLDNVSESSSIISENLEPIKVLETPKNEENIDDVIPSQLEKYFLSGFMGFNKRDSDGSVGSDSEGEHNIEQRRKKLVRARGTNRHNSQDNLNEEQSLNAESQSESSDMDGDENEENNSFDKNDGQFDTIKRTKKKKRPIGVPTMEYCENNENLVENKKNDGEVTSYDLQKNLKMENNFILSNLKATKDINLTQSDNLASQKYENTNKLFTPVVNSGLTRKDSFNNWSSDEETNLMMSKMRSFFKSMIANQRNNASSITKTRNKPPQLIYFESELTRLMKTVPGIRDDQVKEIVEYLSSEDTWSDSYDSSDYTSSDLEVGSKKSPFQQNIAVEYCKIPDICQDGMKKDSHLLYQCLISSFQHTDINKTSSDSSISHNSPPLMNKVMQHIGSRLVALMHEVTESSASTPKVARYHRRLQPKLPTICTTTEEEDDSAEERSPLPRSKSYDPLLEESRQETSDNERFSWRGSFESALMTGSDSHTRLPSSGETSASALALAAAKRRSAGDLLFKSGSSSREHLDRVRSCGSIGGGVEDKIWSMRHPRKRRSSVPEATSNSGESADGENDTDEDQCEGKSPGENLGKSTTLPRTLQTSNTTMTNSLPRLSSSASPSTSIYKVNSSHQFGVKSARYRPPGYNTRTNPGSFSTLCAPPRREYNRRRQANQQIPSPSVSVLNVGGGDDCSVASDISERTGIPDNESEKSHSRISTVTVTRSDSMASVYSGAGEGRYGIVPIRGEAEFSVQYNYKAGDVEIHIKRCSDLAPVDVKRNRSDPYVKVYLLPDKSKSGKRKTRVKKHTLNPVFDEILKYHVPLEELKSRTLWLSVWHSDIFGRNDFLGEVIVPLENKVFDDPLPKLYVLRERSEVPENVSTFKGELIVALKFVLPLENKLKKRSTSEAGALHVLVKEAKNLTAVKSNGTSDPFCKSYLLPNKGRSCKQKTPVLKRTCQPVWNHTFLYNNVTLDEMSQRCLELTIWDHDRLASNEFLGGVRLSLGTGLCNDKSVDWMDSNNREIALWQRMIDHPNFWVESSLILRPSLDMRNKN